MSLFSKKVECSFNNYHLQKEKCPCQTFFNVKILDVWIHTGYIFLLKSTWNYNLLSILKFDNSCTAFMLTVRKRPV